MAEFNFMDLFDPSKIVQLAESGGISFWIGTGVSVIISTILSGILLVLAMEIFKRYIGNYGSVSRVFIVVFIANIINFFGILGLFARFFTGVPLLSVVFPIFLWIILVKILMPETSLKGAVIIGIAGYVVNLAAALVLMPLVIGTMVV